MTPDTFDRSLITWLDDGPTSAPGDIVEALDVELAGIRRRSRPVIALAGLAGDPVIGRVAAIVALAVAVGAAAVFIGPRDQVGGPGPSALPSAAPSEAGSPGSPPPVWTMPPADAMSSYASTVNGYHLHLPAGWSWTPATERWERGTPTAEDSPWLDRAASRDGRLELFGRATDVPTTMTIDDWIASYEASTGTCSTPQEWVEIQTQIGAWAIREICGRFVGLGVVDSRGIVLSLRPVGMQPTRRQIDADAAFFEAIIESFALD
jgi:hypothetical protein